jgi:hypothetical protein
MQEIAMRPTLAFVLASSLLLAAGPAVAQLLVSAGDGRSDCGGNSVNVTDGKGTLDLVGECDKVTIVASGAEVFIAKANVIEILGDGNSVTVETALAELYAVGDDNTVVLAEVEAMHVNGDSNRVEAATVTRVGGVGSNNTVRWREGDPVVEFPAPGNTYGKLR